MDFFDFEEQCMAFVEDVLKQEWEHRFYPTMYEGEDSYRMGGSTEVFWKAGQWTIHHETDVSLDDGTGYEVVTGHGTTLMEAWGGVGKKTIKAQIVAATRNREFMIKTFDCYREFYSKH